MAMFVASSGAASEVSFQERKRIEFSERIEKVVANPDYALVHTSERSLFLDNDGTVIALSGGQLKMAPQASSRTVAFVPSARTQHVLLVRKTRIDMGACREVAISADGSLVVAIGTGDLSLTLPLLFYDGNGKLIRKLGYEEVEGFPARSGTSLAGITDDGSLFVIATRLLLREEGNTKTNRVYLAAFDRNGREIWRRLVGDEDPQKLVISRNSIALAISRRGGECELRLFSLDGKEQGCIRPAWAPGNTELAVSGNGIWLSFVKGCRLSLIDLRTRAIVWEKAETLTGYMPSSVSVSNEGAVLAVLANRRRGDPFHAILLAPSEGSVKWRKSFASSDPSWPRPCAHLAPDGSRFWVFGKSDCWFFERPRK